MSRERWGTFAVNDHTGPRPFVTDVLLYDRLVVPYPHSDSERVRWHEAGWQPQRLDDWLNVLSVYDEDEQPEGLAIIVPWDEQKREVFNTRFRSAQSANFDATHLLDAQKHNVDPFQVTRVILKEDFLPILPKGVSKVWAVAAYPSASEYEKDYTPDIRQERQETLGMALAHKFLAPKPTGKSERELLVQSVKLAKRDDFKEKRSQLYK